MCDCAVQQNKENLIKLSNVSPNRQNIKQNLNFVLVELGLRLLLYFSRKLFLVKIDVETFFFKEAGFKIWVCIIHGCTLHAYTVNMVCIWGC